MTGCCETTEEASRLTIVTGRGGRGGLLALRGSVLDLSTVVLDEGGCDVAEVDCVELESNERSAVAESDTGAVATVFVCVDCSESIVLSCDAITSASVFATDGLGGAGGGARGRSGMACGRCGEMGGRSHEFV